MDGVCYWDSYSNEPQSPFPSGRGWMRAGLQDLEQRLGLSVGVMTQPDVAGSEWVRQGCASTELLEPAPRWQHSQELHLVVFQTTQSGFSTMNREPEGPWPLPLLAVPHKAEDLRLWWSPQCAPPGSSPETTGQ